MLLVRDLYMLKIQHCRQNIQNEQQPSTLVLIYTLCTRFDLVLFTNDPFRERKQNLTLCHDYKAVDAYLKC